MNLYSDKQSKIISRRLRELREKKGLSYEKLEKKLGELGIKIGVQSLKNYEVCEKPHSKFNSVDGMTIKKLNDLATFYGVSTDYLLGKRDTPTDDYGISSICERTGLSQNTAFALTCGKNSNNSPSIFFNFFYDNNGNLRYISTLINELIKNISELNLLYDRLKNEQQEQNEPIRTDLNYVVINAVSGGTICQEICCRILSIQNEIEFTEFKIQKHITDTIRIYTEKNCPNYNKVLESEQK